MSVVNLQRAVIGASVVAVIVALMPHEVSYDKGFAPSWVAVAGARAELVDDAIAKPRSPRWDIQGSSLMWRSSRG
jgi:hypothetical protein